MNHDQPSSESPPLWQRLLIGRHPRRTLVRVVVLVAGSVMLFGFVLLPMRIRGDSMFPTYRDGGINFVNRLAYVRRKPQRGDVVAIQPAAGRHIMYLKRVIGLPGETIAIVQGVVQIDGEPLDEPYVKAREPWTVAARALAAEDYFVIGDNRGMDERSHLFGAVQASNIVGKVLW